MDNKNVKRILLGFVLLFAVGCSTELSTPAFDSIDEFGGVGSQLSTPEATQDVQITDPLAPTPTGGGGRIALEVRSNFGIPTLHTVNPDGTDLQAIGDFIGFLPSWSPFGSQIMYTDSDNRTAESDLFIVDLNGGEVRRVTDTQNREGIPAWSPDGNRVAVTKDINGDIQIYLLNIDDGGIIGQLTFDEGLNHFMPAWSPDGSQLLYVTNPKNENSSEIHIMDANGDNKQQITENDSFDFYPAWSPDGSQIAFISDRDGTRQIYLMDVDGSNTQRLTDVPSDGASRPAWSPDGKIIAFHSRQAGVFSVSLVNIETGEVTLLVEGGAHPAWSSD